MRKFLNILYTILVIQILCILSTSAIAQFQQKPMLGVQVDGANPLSKGLVGLWPFNEGSGNIVSDLSGNGNTGVNAATWVASKYGPALSGGVVTIPDADSLDVSVDYTLICLAQRNAAGTHRLFSKYVAAAGKRSYYLDLGAASYTYFSSPTGDYDAGYIHTLTVPSVATGIKRHIALVKRGSNIYAYSDGVLVATESGIDDSYPGTADLVLLGTNVEMDYAMIYNRALSASEIAELYREPFGMFKKDDIAILATAAVPPPPPTGQVITIIMASIPLFLIPFFFIKRRKLRR